MRAGILLCAFVLLAATGGTRASAQSLNFASSESGAPIQVDADNGIEWRQDEKIFIARGNAVAERAGVKVHADTLRAYYRETPGGSSDIWRLDAEGKVKITSATETATGTTGVYDVDNAILVVHGNPARLVTPTDVITARQQLEYWELRRMAVARGDAEAVRGPNRIRGDVLVGYFTPETKNKPSQMDRIEAFGNVVIVTPNETVRAARGVYRIATETASLEGPVMITRGENQLNGCRALVNMKSGVSRLLSCEPGTGGGRVRGLLVPEKK